MSSRPWLNLDSDIRFQLFGVLFAFGTISHELELILRAQLTGPYAEYMERWSQVKPSTGWPSEVAIPLHVANLLIALAVLVLPWRRALLGLLAVPFLLSNLTLPEDTASHSSLMAGALAVVLILSLAEIVERASQRGRHEVDTTDWYSWTLIGLTWLCASTYIFACLHKLNSGWFSPGLNKAPDFLLGPLEPVFGVFGIQLEGAKALVTPLVMVGVPMTEGLLAFLLLHPRTRLYGCVLGVMFHLPMLAQGIVDFPTLIIAFYPLFLSAEEARTMLSMCLKRPSLPRLIGTLVTFILGAVSILRAEQPNRLYSNSPGLEPLVMWAYNPLLYVALFLFIYVALALVPVVVGQQRTRPARPSVGPGVIGYGTLPISDADKA